MHTYLKQTYTDTHHLHPQKNNHTTPKLLDRIHIVKKKKKILWTVWAEKEDMRMSGRL